MNVFKEAADKDLMDLSSDFELEKAPDQLMPNETSRPMSRKEENIHF